MVDLAFLAKALADSEKAAQASNPYTTTNQVLGSINWDPNDFSTSENLAGGAVKGLLSGFFGGLGENYVTGQKAQAMDLLGSLARGKEIARPEEMDLSVFAPLEQAGGLFALQQDLENEQLAKQSSVKQAEAITSELAKRGVFLTPEGKKLELFNPLQEKADEAAAIEAAKIRGANAAWGDDPALNPDSPQAKSLKGKVELERSLANDFNTRASDFKYKEQTLKALTEAYKDTGGTSDFEIIRRGAQMVEPGLAVRADDQASLEGAASALGVSTQAIKSALVGESKLDPKVRAGIMRIAKRAYNSSLDDYNVVRDSFLTRAEQAKLDKANVVPFGEGKPFESLYPDLEIGDIKPKQAGGISPQAAAAELARRRAARGQ